MSSRHLPVVVFVTCVLIGFGVGLEADGQSRKTVDWTTPDWELPWGMTWPEPPPVEVGAAPTGDVTSADDASVADAELFDIFPSADVGPSAQSASAVAPNPVAEPGVFPGLVNPPAPTPEATEVPEAAASERPEASEESATASEGDTDGASEAKGLTAQLAQLQVLEEQLRVMSAASQTARQAMEAALENAPPAPVEEEVNASPEQVEASLVLLTDMVKKMKPSKAAELLAQWDEALAIGILRRLGSRRATPVLSKMPITLSGRLTSRIAAGVGALLPASAEGAEVPPQGEVQ